MSEELLQRDLINNPEKIGKWEFRNIGATTLNALKNAGIIPKKEYKGFEKRKPDGIITDKKQVIAVVENKNISTFKTKKQRETAYKQGLEVAQVLNAKILILTDTITTIWVNALNGEEIIDEKGRELKEIFNPKNSDLEKLIQQIVDSIDKENSQIREPRLKDPTRLAKSVWQDLWMAAGATAENCLYTFVELFIFKYLSDLDVLKSHVNYDFIMSMFNSESEDEVLEYYAKTVRPHIKKLFPAGSKDNTTIINGTIFVSKDELAVAGYGTVFHTILKKFGNEKDGGGEFKNIDKDFKSKLFETFLKESISKKNWGQYFTPLRVVRAIVRMAESEIKDGISICDPACGVGKFLLEPLLINNNIEHFYSVKKGKLEQKINLIGIDKGFDKEEQKTIILAKANMLIYMSDMIRKNSDLTTQFADIFNDTFELKTKNILGTLRDVDYEGKIDLILTNPPYVTTGSSNLKDEIVKSGLSSHYPINAMGVEGLFMEWIIRALKPGGKAFIVVPDGIFNRQNDKNLRQYILDECFIDGIISLPLKTFFTTPKKTYILCVTKKQSRNIKQTDPIFTYLVSEMGESRDVYRFEITEDDLTSAVDWFNQFKNARKSFRSDDKRCKIQPIEKFNADNHWSIDRWWTKEEQIALGIAEEDKVTTLIDFSDLVCDVSDTLKEYSDLLKEVAEKKKTISNYKEIKLTDEKYFNLFIGKRLLKKDLIHIKGTIPIYSANVNSPISFHTESNIKDFSNNFVIWGIDGNFEYNFIPKNTPFVTTDHCGAIRILSDDIYPEYLMIQLERGRHKYGFDRGLRSSLKNMQEVSIDIPFNKNGSINIDKQKEVIEKYEYILNLRNKIIEYKKQMEKLNIETFSNNDKIITKDIGELFAKNQGNSFYTKKRVIGNGWHGDIPVYSSNTQDDGLLMRMNFDNINPRDLYYQRCLTWSIDGYAGKLFVRNNDNITNSRDEKYYFTINNHCGILLPLVKNLNLEYIKFILQPIFFERSKGYGNKKLGNNQIENIGIPIPIDKAGNFDLEAQTLYVEKYKKIESLKKNISEELDKILEVHINFE
ncbi:MAG: N-6 DNA methylase [Flavobacteriaceae bacterium]|jgi:type I restriction-modification system DNA methylase subunit|nr:N-6 DNA methylase [Flavobacteriaceae bacterium]